MTNTIEEATTAAEALAAWWADQALGTIGNSGGDGVSEMLAIAAGAQGADVEDDRRKAFRTMLEAHIEAMFTTADQVWLGVDYGPDTVLRNAAMLTDVNPGAFPWKTRTSATKDYVLAALGYGAQDRLVWASPDWDRPICGTPKYSGDYSKRQPWVCSLPKFHDERDHAFTTPQPLCQATEGFYIREEGERCRHPQNDVAHLLEDDYHGQFAHAFVPEETND